MRLRFILSIAVLLVTAANQQCFAKEAHAQHGARAGAANDGPSRKGGNKGETKANLPTDSEATIPPPVLPPRGGAHQPNPNSNLNLKIVPAGSGAHNRPTGATNPLAVRNAIGQPVVAPKNFVGAPLKQQSPGAVSPPISHRVPPAAPPIVSSSAARASAPNANLATSANRGSVNGPGVIRPNTPPAGLGGPSRPNYGISGTAVQSKH
jgi:hypothetical protein